MQISRNNANYLVITQCVLVITQTLSHNNSTYFFSRNNADYYLISINAIIMIDNISVLAPAGFIWKIWTRKRNNRKYVQKL